MLDSFKRFFADLAGGEKDQSGFEDNDYRVAAAALLIHATTIDGAMSDIEHDRLVDLLRQRFTLDQAAAAELVTAATKAEQQAVDLYHFTSLLDRTLDDAGRQQIVEMLWQIVYADGRVTEFEENLIWRAADLLHVPSEARIALRQRVAATATNGSRQVAGE
ncbi:MAG TPA: TerB family tellurite resistance protein [Xanthobacteraceae bacterium]|nr:TerB family tellurite resistance protein [Xanthobacteraceae bacterium]